MDILNSENPSLVKIVKEFGNDGELTCKAILTVLINDMLNFFNVGKTMSPDQVATTINLILEDYATLKPDDFKLCFKRAMRGQYGKVYDRIDGELIFEWLEQFLYEKTSEIEQFRRNENTRLKKQSLFQIGQENPTTPEAVPMPDYVKELIKKKEPKIKPLEPLKLSDEQIYINGYIKRFDVLVLRQRLQIKGGRFVKVYGRIMNVEDYLNYKVVVQPEIVRNYLKGREELFNQLKKSA